MSWVDFVHTLNRKNFMYTQLHGTICLILTVTVFLLQMTVVIECVWTGGVSNDEWIWLKCSRQIA